MDVASLSRTHNRLRTVIVICWNSAHWLQSVSFPNMRGHCGRVCGSQSIAASGQGADATDKLMPSVIRSNRHSQEVSGLPWRGYRHFRSSLWLFMRQRAFIRQWRRSCGWSGVCSAAAACPHLMWTSQTQTPWLRNSKGSEEPKVRSWL